MNVREMSSVSISVAMFQIREMMNHARDREDLDSYVTLQKNFDSLKAEAQRRGLPTI